MGRIQRIQKCCLLFSMSPFWVDVLVPGRKKVFKIGKKGPVNTIDKETRRRYGCLGHVSVQQDERGNSSLRVKPLQPTWSSLRHYRPRRHCSGSTSARARFRHTVRPAKCCALCEVVSYHDERISPDSATSDRTRYD